MKKLLRIIFVLLLLWNVMLVIQPNVFATVDEVNNITGRTLNGNSDKMIAKPLGALFVIFQIAGTGIALVMLAWIGIKYMMAAPDEKAEIKKSATVYIVGALILFGTVAIVTIIESFAVDNIKV